MERVTKTCQFCGGEILAVAIKCKHCLSMLIDSQGEEILADVPANLFRGIEGVGGRLKITSCRILFEPHAINFQRMPAEILLDDVAEVRKRNTIGLLPNGLLVRTKDGVKYKFVVWNRKKLISIIESKIRKAS